MNKKTNIDIADVAVMTFVAMIFVGIFYVLCYVGSFEVVNSQGKQVSLFPFSTEQIVKARALKECGSDCVVNRVN